MQDHTDKDEPPTRILAELSALADGTLEPSREAALREQIARSPELSARYERERRAVAALSAVSTDRAPAGLRARIEAERGRRARRAWPRLGIGWGTAAAAAVAVAALAVVLLLPAGTPGGPSISQAASLAMRGAAFPAPPPSGKLPEVTLNEDVQEVYFPNWSYVFGWHATGQRNDSLDGRKAVTVYYTRHGRQIAYTIVTAPALKLPNATTYRLAGTKFQSFSLGERQVVTWRRADHTCVLSGVGVSPAELSRLAAWNAPAAAL